MTQPRFKILIEQRARNQELMLRLLTYLQKHKKTLSRPENLERSTLTLFVGACFSLWRAAFLLDAKRTSKLIVKDAESFMEKLLTDNVITYPQDRQTLNWMGGYYLNNAQYRIARILEKLEIVKRSTEPDIEAFQNSRSKSFDSVKDSLETWDVYFRALNKAFEIFSSKAGRK